MYLDTEILIQCIDDPYPDFTDAPDTTGGGDWGENLKWVGSPSHLFYTKTEWGGINATSSVLIDEPVQYVVISHTAGAFCYDTATCRKMIRNIQKVIMKSFDTKHATF